MIICELSKENAHEFLEMQLQLDQETDNMMFEAGERPNDIGRVINNIESNKGTGSVVFLAYVDGKCAGFLLASRGSLKRIRHGAYIVIGILNNYQGKGIGSAFFDRLMEWAENNKLKRLELTVMTHNQAGVNLYKKYGFEIEGIKRCAMFVNNVYVDEYYMARIL
jgi:RimJ/RimL family protein N-acetyltransferase